MVGAPANKDTFEGSAYSEERRQIETLRYVNDVCQFTEILWCPGRLCQFVNIEI